MLFSAIITGTSMTSTGSSMLSCASAGSIVATGNNILSVLTFHSQINVTD